MIIKCLSLTLRQKIFTVHRDCCLHRELVMTATAVRPAFNMKSGKQIITWLGIPFADEYGAQFTSLLSYD